ncbi:MAG: restriction endonuclease subunit S [Rhizobacter sp.]|nr:restriction endonuclease subunit S [Rhizobacter sp.]
MEVREPSVRCRALPKLRQTELGVFPDDWAIVPLTEFYRFQNGVNADRTAYGKGVPFVNVLEVITHGRLLDSRIPGRVELPESVLANFALRFGDVLFNRTSETQEEVGLASVFAGDAATVFGGFVIRGIPRNSRLKPNFASYVLRSPAVRAQIIARGQGAVRANVGQADLATIKVPLPDPDEQEAIAKALSDADVLIESLEQLIAKKRQIKQGAMQELFAPYRGGKWPVVPLRENLFAAPDYGINAPAVPFSDRLPTYLRITDITEDGRFAAWSRVSVQRVNAERYYLGDGDAVFARTGASVGKSYLYRESDGPLVFAGFLIRVRVDPTKLVPAFFLYFAQTGPYWDWIRLMSMRSGQPGVNGQQFSEMPVPMPCLREQAAIAQTLSDMDAELTALEARLAKARALKQGMAQALLTGRIRLV